MKNKELGQDLVRAGEQVHTLQGPLIDSESAANIPQALQAIFCWNSGPDPRPEADGIASHHMNDDVFCPLASQTCDYMPNHYLGVNQSKSISSCQSQDDKIRITVKTSTSKINILASSLDRNLC